LCITWYRNLNCLCLWCAKEIGSMTCNLPFYFFSIRLKHNSSHPVICLVLGKLLVWQQLFLQTSLILEKLSTFKPDLCLQVYYYVLQSFGSLLSCSHIYYISGSLVCSLSLFPWLLNFSHCDILFSNFKKILFFLFINNVHTLLFTYERKTISDKI
jgi:hypothetical protein